MNRKRRMATTTSLPTWTLLPFTVLVWFEKKKGNCFIKGLADGIIVIKVRMDVKKKFYYSTYVFLFLLCTFIFFQEYENKEERLWLLPIEVKSQVWFMKRRSDCMMLLVSLNLKMGRSSFFLWSQQQETPSANWE